MPATLRAVDLSFFDTAPLRFVSTEVLHHPAAAIFSAFADDPAGWGDWFPGFSHQGRYLTPPPHGTGATREVVMTGIRFRETVIAWEAPTRWAFYLDESGLPLARAFAEDYRVVDRGDHAVVQWTLALDPRGPLTKAEPLGHLLVPRLFRRAMTNLSRKLTTESASAGPLIA